MPRSVASSAGSRHIGGAPRPPVAPAAVDLLGHARRELVDAERHTDQVERFVCSYACALRAASAVVAARGRPHRGRSRPASVWALLAEAAPELGEWAAFFAAHSGLHAAAQAGIGSRVSSRAADDLMRQAGQFLDLAWRTVSRDSRDRACRTAS